MSNYISTTDRAKMIRQQLKRELGATARDISVKSDLYSMGSSIRVTIKSAAFSKAAVERIATAHERVYRDEATGEILGGGNRFVDVEYTAEALAPFCAVVLAAVPADAQPGVRYAVQVAGAPVVVWRDADRDYWRATVDGVERDVFCWGRESCARQVAELALSMFSHEAVIARDLAAVAANDTAPASNAQIEWLCAMGIEVSA